MILKGPIASPPLPIVLGTSTHALIVPFPIATPSLFQTVPISIHKAINHGDRRAVFKKSCAKRDEDQNPSQCFSVLSVDVPWHVGDMWSTFAFYFLTLHIPLSFGGLSIVAQILHQSHLDPLMMAVSNAILQTCEFFGAAAVLQYTAKPECQISHFFLHNLFSRQRSWIKAFSLGITFLIGLAFLTSILADWLVGPKDVNDPVLREILSDSPSSQLACFYLYCFITPLLEEIVYRGFLLTSLATVTKGWQAVIISASVFSLAHFSCENSLQLFLIGGVLGLLYCWSGSLAASFTVHSLYNAMVLIVTIMS